MQRGVGDATNFRPVISASADHRFEVMKETCADHERIFSALEKADVEEARRAMAAHIRNGLVRTTRPEPPSGDRWWKADAQ